MKKGFFIMFAMFMATINVFADKESDAFLKKVVLMEDDGISLMSGANINITTSYEKKVFTVSTSLDGNMKYGADQFLDKFMTSFVSNDEMMVIEVLNIERQNKGFVENMLKSNAGLKLVVNIKATGQTYEQQMKAKQIKNINLADTANVDKMVLELQLRTINAVLPINIDDDVSMNKLSIEDKCMVLELLTKEKKTTIEQIDDMKDIFEVIYVNMMKSNMFAQYVGKANLDIAIRFRSAIREKHTDLYIPFSKAEELFDPNNQIDSTDVMMATFVYTIKKVIPIEINNEEVFKDISYKDKTISCVIELKGQSAEYIYDFDKIGKLDLICSNNTMLTKMMQNQSIPGWRDIKIMQVYRNAEWGKDIIYETSTKKDIDYMNNAGLKDSILIAQLAELNNLYRKGGNGVKEVHEYDGNVYTIKILLSKKNMAPQSYIRFAGTSEFIDVLQKDYKHLCEVLHRRKKNIRYVTKNTVTGKEESIIIPYEIIY